MHSSEPYHDNLDMFHMRCFEPVFGNLCLCSVCVYLLSSIIICFEPVFSNFCLIIIKMLLLFRDSYMNKLPRLL